MELLRRIVVSTRIQISTTLNASGATGSSRSYNLRISLRTPTSNHSLPKILYSTLGAQLLLFTLTWYLTNTTCACRIWMLSVLLSVFSGGNKLDHNPNADNRKALINSTTKATGLMPTMDEMKGDVAGTTTDSEQASCIFCDVSREKGFDVVYEVCPRSMTCIHKERISLKVYGRRMRSSWCLRTTGQRPLSIS